MVMQNYLFFRHSTFFLSFLFCLLLLFNFFFIAAHYTMSNASILLDLAFNVKESFFSKCDFSQLYLKCLQLIYFQFFLFSHFPVVLISFSISFHHQRLVLSLPLYSCGLSMIVSCSLIMIMWPNNSSSSPSSSFVQVLSFCFKFDKQNIQKIFFTLESIIKFQT